MTSYLCPGCWKATRETPAESLDDRCDACRGESDGCEPAAPPQAD